MLERARLELSSELVKRINRHRHGLSHEECIRRCVDDWLHWQTASARDAGDSEAYVPRQEFEEFKSDSEMFLRAFLRFRLGPEFSGFFENICAIGSLQAHSSAHPCYWIDDQA